MAANEPAMPEEDDTPMDVEGGIMDICRRDPRFAPAAYRFVMYEGIEYTTREYLQLTEATRRHLTGQEVCEGLRRLALSQFGFMAFEVWQSWGIRTTADWGRVVFNLCDHKLLQRTEQDTLEDFENVYDLRKGLKAAFKFEDAISKA
ncbi:MAG: hypothetical protein IPP14_00415 [Planctomycetes bacterium]|nr:hypothetical protein [Planctomycetota bacterium]